MNNDFKLIILVKDYILSLEELLISNTYESIKSNLVALPNLPKNSEEKAKKIQEFKNLLAKTFS